MERAGILINKLQEQFAAKADLKSMLLTTQMLQAELMQYAQKQNGSSSSKVAVVLPFSTALMQQVLDVPETIDKTPEPVAADSPVEQDYPPAPEFAAVQAKVVQPKQQELTVVNEEPGAVIKESVVVVKDNQNRNGSSGWLFHPGEVPTLAHQEKGEMPVELNDTIQVEGGSLNETLKEEKTEVAHSLQGTPIKDLKKAISINDRHRFIHDLFRDDETMYERSIKTINSFNIFPEAEYWIQRELKLKLGWDVNSETVKIFDQLVKRRFS